MLGGVKRTRFHRWPCSIARAADLVGDAWTLLILREAFYGVRRFDRFEAELGIGRNILARRLDRMVRERLLERVPYQERPRRHEYRLLPRGRALFPVLMALFRFGDEWLAGEEGPPIALVQRRTGRPVRPRVVDEETGAELGLEDVRAVPGPGFPPDLLRTGKVRRRFRLPPRYPA
jgi:DNA-binding HxlR family transcriptional regulator